MRSPGNTIGVVVEAELSELVARALAEDIGAGDITSAATVPEDARARARIVQKEPGVLFGLGAAEEALRQCGVQTFDRLVIEGQWRDGVPADIALASGPARGLLAAERTAMNLLCHLSGVATLTARYVEAVRGTGARILDTRKTTPGLRALEKAAVLAGGGMNHRAGLHDAILIKENHIAVAGGLEQAVRRCKDANPGAPVEVECRDLEDVEAALRCGAERLLLDNMGAHAMRAAVERREAASASVELEASGGVDLAGVRRIAETGVDLISVGAITHSAPALDLSMLVE